METVLDGEGGHVERGEHRAASFPNDERAVSYTHLDVYKRQLPLDTA